jgi:mono/diheme cytochrome c family protein
MRIMIIAIGLMLILAACAPKPPSVLKYEDLPTVGDAARGAVLFSQPQGLAPSCESCHNPTATGSPLLDGFGARAGTVVEGQTAHEYAFYSIVEPWQHITEGFGDAMYNQYDELLPAQDIADIIAYILGL